LRRKNVSFVCQYPAILVRRTTAIPQKPPLFPPERGGSGRRRGGLSIVAVFFHFPGALDKFRQVIYRILCMILLEASYILCFVKKGRAAMTVISKEYLLLFNIVTDTEKSLAQLRETLLEAQRQAEELFLEESAKDEPFSEQ
jgi:hypothetical protein